MPDRLFFCKYVLPQGLFIVPDVHYQGPRLCTCQSTKKHKANMTNIRKSKHIFQCCNENRQLQVFFKTIPVVVLKTQLFAPKLHMSIKVAPLLSRVAHCMH